MAWTGLHALGYSNRAFGAVTEMAILLIVIGLLSCSEGKSPESSRSTVPPAEQGPMAMVMEHSRLGEFEEAHAACRKIIAEHPGAPVAFRARFEIASMYHRQGKNREAMDAYKEIVDDPGSGGYAASAIPQYINCFIMTSLDTAPPFEDIERRIAEEVPFDELIESCSETIAGSDNIEERVRARYLLAKIYGRKQLEDASQSQLEAIPEQYPASAVAPFALIDIAERRWREEAKVECIEILDGVIRDYPGTGAATVAKHSLSHKLLGTRDGLERAVSLCDSILASGTAASGYRSGAHYTKAQIYLKQGESREAMRELDLCIAEAPTSGIGEQAERDHARIEDEAGGREVPHRVEMDLQSAQGLVWQGKEEEAVAAFDAFLERNPEGHLAEIAKRDRDRALDALEGNAAATRFTLGYLRRAAALMRLGRPERATADIDRFLERVPEGRLVDSAKSMK